MRAVIITLLALAFSIQAGTAHTGSVACPGSGNLAVLSTSVKTVAYSILAPVGNTGTIYLGQSNVTTVNGFPLVAGAAYNAPTQGNASPYDLSNVYFACSVNSDSIKYLYQ